MKIIDEQTFGKSWHDGYSPIIFIRLNDVAPAKNDIPTFFKKIENAKHQLVKKFDDVFAIVDLTSSTQTELENLISAMRVHLYKLLDRDLKVFCVVSAPSLNINFNDFNDNRIIYFQTHYQALEKVNKLRLESVVN